MHSAIDTAGPLAAHIEWLFWVFVGVAVAVYVAVLTVLVYALRRRRMDGPRAEAKHDDAKAVRYIGASAGLTAIVLAGLGLADFFAGRALARVPEDAMRVRVTAHQWWWEVEYLDADPSQRVRTANELHIPVNRPVALELISDDVIHSFWVPSLNGKKDLLPGYTTSLQLVASRPGEYTGKCAEFCGFQHARMDIAVHAHEAGDFLKWQDDQRRAAPEPADAVQARGREVFLKSTCPQCHMVLGTDAAAMFGPDLTHVASRPQLAAGTLPNNRAMLAAWISDPRRFKPGTRMPATALSSEDLAALVTWLMSLE
jgi:cytochrome c oxidase subunit 2